MDTYIVTAVKRTAGRNKNPPKNFSVQMYAHDQEDKDMIWALAKALKNSPEFSDVKLERTSQETVEF